MPSKGGELDTGNSSKCPKVGNRKRRTGSFKNALGGKVKKKPPTPTPSRSVGKREMRVREGGSERGNLGRGNQLMWGSTTRSQMDSRRGRSQGTQREKGENPEV